MAGGKCSLRCEEIAFSLANAGQIRYCECRDGYHRKEGQQMAAPKRPPRRDHAQERKRRIPSWLYKSKGPKEKPCPIKGQRRRHSEEKQANWPREDGGRGRISLRRDDGSDWDLSVHLSYGGFREIRLHSERILAKPQGVLTVRDGSYKSTHQPMNHSVRRLYHSNAVEVNG